MLYIFHGDGIGNSRKLLQTALASDKALGHELHVLEGDKFAAKDLETALTTASLFSVESILIENLLTRLRSKEKDACLELLSSYAGDKQIYLWDKKEVTPANLKKFPKAKVSHSKAPTALFDLLDSLYPGNSALAIKLLHQVVSGTEDIVVFTMIARQVSYLIIILSATNPKFAPWQIGKLRSQAQLWTLPHLIEFMTELTTIDYKIKTGATKLSYGDHLDLLLLSLLR